MDAIGPVFIAGSQSASGLVGAVPDLSNLDKGDIKMTIDLREIYAAVVEDRLGVNATSVLSGFFTKAMIFQS